VCFVFSVVSVVSGVAVCNSDTLDTNVLSKLDPKRLCRHDERKGLPFRLIFPKLSGGYASGIIQQSFLFFHVGYSPPLAYI